MLKRNLNERTWKNESQAKGCADGQVAFYCWIIGLDFVQAVEKHVDERH